MAILRKLRVRSPNALDAAIRFALRCVSSHDCLDWFRHAVIVYLENYSKILT